MKRRFITLLLALLITVPALAERSSSKHALLKSIVLPGWGEYSYGSGSAYIFLGTEIALWAGFGALRYSAGTQDRDLISYTRLHAGMESFPENKQYWADLGNYDSYLDHRETMLENRTPERIWSSDYSWEWDSGAASQQYRELYRKKELTLLGADFLIAGFIVNRVASAINVKYLEKKHMQLSAFASPARGGGNLYLGLSF